MCCDYVVSDYRVWALEGIDVSVLNSFYSSSANVRSTSGVSYHEKFNAESNTWDVLLVGDNTLKNVDDFESVYRNMLVEEIPVGVDYLSRSVSQDEVTSLIFEFSGIKQEVQNGEDVSNVLKKNDYVPLDENVDMIEKLKHFLFTEYKRGWFSSRELKDAYIEIIDSEARPLTISTYISRMHQKNLLFSRGNKNNTEYCLNLDNWNI